ncbi:50S ribosomal protein L9 [Thermosyntropha sp.]|uniref:50S ribosomal protein L9 n=1 Tax=Thermosyntropha sp. TaxID=2740820 RepID=UPI0025FC3D75|nr:50S ribosomal protein L9 [Thermosyntropha sp.]MBO8159644.1 50S ribosomal protein L9 [Thermosyntropha sp.]
MKVILTQDIKQLGRAGDIKEVSDGYARNYLIPKGLAVEATAGKIKEVEEKKKSQERQKMKELEQAKELQKKLNGKEITIKAKTGDNDRLFGAVTPKEIAEAINKEFKVSIDKKKIEIGEPIKHLGEYNLKIKIYPGVQAEIKVKVVKG